ncbi:hypothetical protein W911_07635 [Hyphomicrobium nitrativorans NL23]|uniref:YcxB-like protein domain-containing protein n=1 Tax=Hyphomicrobium nitrativorans NL23 TaxID=1029756 RepID=V5SHW2_9HYPH|nr:hypothetical protein [Hyphomicrobium nitrativorans]AHB50087.1 hypothetical protein W911_07635 [Hyphomicrobium nitrativorans NL23]
MLDRELRYQMPFERLAKLSRAASRKAFSSSWYLMWGLFAVYFSLLGGMLLFADTIGRLQREAGIPRWSWMVVLGGILIGGLLLLRRHGQKQAKARADYDSTVTLRQEAEGLRFATPEIEYFIKWDGISQMMTMHDGVVVSHGSLFFLVPDTAFAGRGERDAFVRDVYGRLNEAAIERSEPFIRPLLDAASSTTRT